MEAAQKQPPEPDVTRDWTIASLMRDGRLNYRDLDSVYVANGFMSYDAIATFLRSPEASADEDKVGYNAEHVSDVSETIVKRICGCQYHDGGKTELESADATSVTLRFTGTCTHCPQIKYTARILEDALRSHLPDLDDVTFTGIDLKTKSELPVNRQFTLGAFCKEYGITPKNLDEAIQRLGKVFDHHLPMIALKATTTKKLNG